MYALILVIVAVIRAIPPLTAEKACHLVLIQLHITAVAVGVFVVFVEFTAFTAGFVLISVL